MELRQLSYLVAVAEEGNFTRAAERVHISQSGVSAQIHQLELDLGDRLINRSGRTATLTPAGEAALPHVRAVLAEAEAVRQAVAEVTGVVRGRLVFGMVTACTITPLFSALSGFHADHEGVQLSVLEENSEQLIARVRTGEIDIALVGVAGDSPEGLQSFSIISEPIVAAVATSHPLAGRGHVGIASVCAYPIVTMPKGTGIRTVFDQACAANGVVADVALEAAASATVADLASRGLGVAILSESITAALSGSLTMVGLDGVPSLATLAFVWGEHESPALRELLRHFRSAFSPPPLRPNPGASSTSEG